MKQVLSLFITLIFVAFVKANNSTTIEQPACVYMNTNTANGRNYYSFFLPTKYACAENGFMISLCDSIIPEMIELSFSPDISIKNKFYITLFGKDDLRKSLEQTLLDTVKGPNQYFVVPEDSRIPTTEVGLKIPESDICDNQDTYENIIVQIYGVSKVVELDDDDISEDLEALCYNSYLQVPFNILLDEDKYKERLIDDLNALEKEDNDVVTKLLTATYVSKKGNPDDGLCRGYLYLKALNECNKIRIEEVPNSKPLPKNIDSVVKIGDKAPQFIKDCVRELKIKPDEKIDYSKAKSVEDNDWFVKFEL